MLLRMSSQTNGTPVDLNEVMNADEAAGGESDFGLPGGAALRGFALALVRRKAIQGAREQLIESLGAESVAVAAGVVGAFEAVNRIADATGTRLDTMMATALKGPLAGLGIDSLSEEAPS